LKWVLRLIVIRYLCIAICLNHIFVFFVSQRFNIEGYRQGVSRADCNTLSVRELYGLSAMSGVI